MVPGERPPARQGAVPLPHHRAQGPRGHLEWRPRPQDDLRPLVHVDVGCARADGPLPRDDGDRPLRRPLLPGGWHQVLGRRRHDADGGPPRTGDPDAGHTDALLAGRRAGLQAPDTRHPRPGGRFHADLRRQPRHRTWTGTSSSSKPAPPAGRTGRPCPMRMATPARTSAPARGSSRRTRSSAITSSRSWSIRAIHRHPRTTRSRATRPGRAASGTLRAARAMAGRPGRSRCRTRRRATRQVEVSITYASDQSVQGRGVTLDNVVSSTGSRFHQLRGRRRTSSMAGLPRWPDRPAAPPTRTRGRQPRASRACPV